MSLPEPAAARRGQVLVVDDQPVNLRIVHQLLSAEHEVLVASSGEQALAMLARSKPDLVLLDVQLPGISGLDVCRQMRQVPELQAIPVIFITGGTRVEEENACWEAGGNDFVCKPVNALTLRHRVQAHLKLKYYVDALNAMAFADGLTGIANRRHFDERLDNEWRRCGRSSLPIAVLMIDVDFFKRYNDRYGHLAGDDCLKQIAAALKAGLGRPFDLAARFGGEEFACLLPETDAAGALAIAGKLEAAVRALAIEHLDSTVAACVSVSIGVAAVLADLEQGSQALVEQADAALYRAKQQGRGRASL